MLAGVQPVNWLVVAGAVGVLIGLLDRLEWGNLGSVFASSQSKNFVANLGAEDVLAAGDAVDASGTLGGGGVLAGRETISGLRLVVDFGDKTIDLSVQSRVTKLNSVMQRMSFLLPAMQSTDVVAESI